MLLIVKIFGGIRDQRMTPFVNQGSDLRKKDKKQWMFVSFVVHSMFDLPDNILPQSAVEMNYLWWKTNPASYF